MVRLFELNKVCGAVFLEIVKAGNVIPFDDISFYILHTIPKDAKVFIPLSELIRFQLHNFVLDHAISRPSLLL